MEREGKCSGRVCVTFVVASSGDPQDGEDKPFLIISSHRTSKSSSISVLVDLDPSQPCQKRRGKRRHDLKIASLLSPQSEVRIRTSQNSRAGET